MISNLGAGFDASIQATGKVRKNQIGFSLISLSLLPIIFVLYKLGLPPYINVIVMVFLTILTLLFQIYIMKELTGFQIKEYTKQTIVPSLTSTICICVILFPNRWVMPNRMVATIFFLSISVVLTIFTTYLFGMNKTEKTIIYNFIKIKVLKKIQ